MSQSDTTLKKHNITVAFRYKHVNSTYTTHMSKTQSMATRLHRIYTPSTHHIAQCKHLIETLHKTYHKVALACIHPSHTNNPQSFRRSLKYNSTLLQNTDYIQFMTDVILTYTDRQYHKILKLTENVQYAV